MGQYMTNYILDAALELSGQFVTSDHHELEQNEPYTLLWIR
jgi:hypothetical protein